MFARNRYVIYLCLEDYESLVPQKAQVTSELTSKLAKHVRDMRYALQGDLAVELVLDQDLELGYFGILAQRAYPQQSAAEAAVQAAPPAAGAAAAAPPPAPPASAAVPAAAAAAAGVASAGPAEPAGAGIPAAEAIAAKQAEELDLAQRVIVIGTGGQVREFAQSRVVLGRSKEADLRIDDPNVSRKHAAIYWSNGRLVLEDLGSTNGTMVNGYPVTTTVLRPQDVVAIGESRLTVESK